MDSMYEINRRRRSRSRTRAREENTFKSIPNLNLGSEFTEGGYSLAGPEADPGRMYRSLGYIPDTDPAEGNVWTPQEQRQYEVSWQRKSSKKRLNKLRLAVKFVTFSTECYELIVIFNFRRGRQEERDRKLWSKSSDHLESETEAWR